MAVAELPDYPDESMLEYMAGMLVEYSPDLDEDILRYYSHDAISAAEHLIRRRPP
jgi:hypothetical protein